MKQKIKGKNNTQNNVQIYVESDAPRRGAPGPSAPGAVRWYMAGSVLLILSAGVYVMMLSDRLASVRDFGTAAALMLLLGGPLCYIRAHLAQNETPLKKTAADPSSE